MCFASSGGGVEPHCSFRCRSSSSSRCFSRQPPISGTHIMQFFQNEVKLSWTTLYHRNCRSMQCLAASHIFTIYHMCTCFQIISNGQVLRSNPHHVALRRRFLARAHVIASERAGNASLAALAELERLATVERNKQPSPEEHASQERDQAPRLQQAEAQAQAREDTATAAATAAEEKPRAQAKAKRMRVKQLAVAASAGARAYAEHIAAAAERAKSWYTDQEHILLFLYLFNLHDFIRLPLLIIAYVHVSSLFCCLKYSIHCR